MSESLPSPTTFARALLLVVLASTASPVCAQALSDPTARGPAPTAAAPDSPWRLQSTLVSDARRVAVVNGKVVVEGDMVAGAQVERIGFGEVWLRVSGRQLRVGMFGNAAPALPVNGRSE